MTEQERVKQMTEGTAAWRFFGPYLSERQWGTVREDYSADGDAWDYFPHDHARTRAYRWGEDGMAGISDENQRLCLSLALWNGQDSILKERLFGLTNKEGNHGEDVKEVYYYLDATPTHSYLKALYKYPQAAYPYELLVEENRKRSRHEPEFELADTGVFAESRYFDVFVEYAKQSPTDVLMRITVHNRGDKAASIHVLPQVWFRNTWSWDPSVRRPQLRAAGSEKIEIRSTEMQPYSLYVEAAEQLLFTDNDSDRAKLGWNDPVPGFYKDAFHEAIVNGNTAAVNPAQVGTKAAGVRQLLVQPGQAVTVRVRLCQGDVPKPFAGFDETVSARQQETDAFFADFQQEIASPDERAVQRQALAGMIWTKQFYFYDVRRWLQGDPGQLVPPESRKHGRNADWTHVNNADIISMPDKWEYPWYAAWDLAFHTLALALVDPQFAKQQLVLITRERYMHPNGQLPAYEWAFDNVNPPVHGWAAWRVFQIDRKQRRRDNPQDPGDLDFLERVFHKLMLNFTWWVNRKDAAGRNVFQGGFLGLDNVGVFDRSAPLPDGGYLNQADATSWMAMYSLNLMRIALELAQRNHVYEDIATKFFQHYLNIAEAMTNIASSGIGLWNEEDGFFYDVMNPPEGDCIPIQVRSIVGLIPLFAVETLEPELLERVPDFKARLESYLALRPDLASLVSHWSVVGAGDRRLLSLLRGHRMKLLLKRMLNESEFLSEYGVRSLSRSYSDNPYKLRWDGQMLEIDYEPGESTSSMFGGNSNWRGPIWFPLNFLIIESLQKFHHYYGDDFKVECPTGSGNFATIEEIAKNLELRLANIFLRQPNGKRAVFGDSDRLQNDPNYRDYIPFYEYFHGDEGYGLGASHQTGWTGLIAKLLHPRDHSHHH